MQEKPQYYVSSFCNFFTIFLLLIKFHGLFESWFYSDRLQNDSEENIQTIPTIGFNVEVLQYKNIKFQVRLTLPLLFLCLSIQN